MRLSSDRDEDILTIEPAQRAPIDHWSLWLDGKILARTAWVVLAGTGK